jgi:hypothetical protein
LTIATIGFLCRLREVYGAVPDMDYKEEAAAFFLRAATVREIANGLFDKAEREIVLKFVAECETLKLAMTDNAGK